MEAFKLTGRDVLGVVHEFYTMARTENSAINKFKKQTNVKWILTIDDWLAD